MTKKLPWSAKPEETLLGRLTRGWAGRTTAKAAEETLGEGTMCRHVCGEDVIGSRDRETPVFVRSAIRLEGETEPAGKAPEAICASQGSN